MPYIPITDREREEMLKIIGKGIEELFSVIPEESRPDKLPDFPGGLSEIELRSYFKELASKNNPLVPFAGLGVYDHYIPSVINHIISRPEFFTAYTPYQPEVSQGTLQAIYEYQSMICELTGMDVSNASMYDGATSLAEAIFMAIAITRRKRVIVSKGVNPLYRKVLETYLSESAEIEYVPVDNHTGMTGLDAINPDGETACFVIQHPNYLGVLEDVFTAEEKIHSVKGLYIVVFDPISLGILKPPGEYNADIAVAEGQPLGLPLNYGGPYLGIFTSKKEYIRQMPGRIIGRTVDADGNRGFVMTLQTREQHIRRERATSNICTNQQLCALAAAVYLATMGKQGIREVAYQTTQKAHFLSRRLEDEGIKRAFTGDFFREFVVRLNNVETVIKKGIDRGILAGTDIGAFESDFKNFLLISLTEKRTMDEMDKLIMVVTNGESIQR